MLRENIKRICKEQGRSIHSVESATGISKGYIHTMKNPSINMLEKIADELGVNVCELLTEKDE